MKKIHQIFPLRLPSHKEAAKKAGVCMKGTRGECALRIALHMQHTARMNIRKKNQI